MEEWEEGNEWRYNIALFYPMHLPRFIRTIYVS
jgi:hypothetical protein